MLTCSAQSLLEVQHLVKYYANESRPALHDVSFCLRAGETLGILGASGSGKTTLLKILIGWQAQTSGKVFLEGKLLLPKKRAASFYRQVQFVSQQPQEIISSRMTLGEFLVYSLQAFGGKKEGDFSAKINSLLEEVGLSKKILPSLPHEVSGGQLQRLVLARALAVQPQLLLLDEPASALDALTQMHFFTLLRQLQAEHNFALLVITHDVLAIKEVTQSLLIMKDGSLIERLADKQTPQSPYTEALFQAAMLPLRS